MSEPLPLSVLLLARDESLALERLLPALAFARETVVVWDDRGDPGTRDLAERLGARVIPHAFEGFGPQRQFALSQCREPWVLWIDADELPSDSMERDLRGQLAGAGAAESASVREEVAAWRLVRRTWFLGRRIRHCGWGDEKIVRLFRRDRARFDDAPVHERVVVDGAVGDLPCVLEHHSYETIDVCIEKMVRYARAGAEKAWRVGRRAGAIDVALRPPLRFLRQYLLQAGFLDGAHGLALCCFAAAQVAIKYAELWERTRLARSERPGKRA